MKERFSHAKGSAFLNEFFARQIFPNVFLKF